MYKACPSCGQDHPIETFRAFGRCIPCDIRRNKIISIAERMVGGRATWRALSRNERVETKADAEVLYEQGRNYVAAVRNLPLRKDGCVYVITNPAWPDHVKIGCALNPRSRLDNYQTGSPFRDYELEHFEYFEDRRAAEQTLLAQLGASQALGEWHQISAGAAVWRLRELARGEKEQQEAA